MSRSLVALWATLLAAIASVTIFAQFWIRGREQSAQNRVTEILRSQLVPTNESIARIIGEYSVELERELSGRDLSDLNDCLEVSRLPLADLLVVVNDEGQLQFPANLSGNDPRWALLEEGQQLLVEQLDPRPKPPTAGPQLQQAGEALLDLEDAPRTQSASPAQAPNAGELRSRSYQVTKPQSQVKQVLPPQAMPSRVDELGSQPSPNSGPSSPAVEDDVSPVSREREGLASTGERSSWITWYHRRGMVLGYRWHQEPEWYALVALPRGRWMADVVAILPESHARIERNAGLDPVTPDQPLSVSPLAGSLTQLVDVEGAVIYQWGTARQNLWEELTRRAPAAELPVTNPLEGWRLRTYATDDLIRQLAGDDLVLPIWLAVAGLSTTLVLLGLFATSNLRRQVRLAASRVSFVNQVSHELRTPLTNICMYADLLLEDLEAMEEPLQPQLAGQLRRVAVIQQETRRLNRLISNVLEFAQSDRVAKPLRTQQRSLDDVIQEVLATFMPRLDELQFEVRLKLEAPHIRTFDPDIVEQILVNLIGNAEKYAASGKRLELQSWGTEDRAGFRVRDTGPGIPTSMADKIFLPFERLGDRLEDPAGTGIGLTIARDLARQHGGDCMLESTGSGASFVCTLAAPIVESPSPQSEE